MKEFFFSLLALLFGFAVALGIAAILGESPVNVVTVMANGALGTATQLGYSLFYATPLLLTGLSVAWAGRAGLFNIGAEGQMTMGGVAMAAVGILFPNLAWPVAIPFALVVGFLVGGAWGAMAGWMKAKRGCHEVLSTILLNFVAYGISAFLIVGWLKSPDAQVPETAPVGTGYQIAAIPGLGGTSPLNFSLVIALACVALYGFLFYRTRLGLHQRIAGGAPMAGRLAGINMDKQTITAMFFAGGFAALAAASPVLGFAFKAREGFPSGAGFVGIAVALLARNRALGIVVSALLFGVLTKGALDLDIDTDHVSKDLAVVIQALIVIAVATQPGFMNLFAGIKNRRIKVLGTKQEVK
jgi:general nucleoside transport system permease protein